MVNINISPKQNCLNFLRYNLVINKYFILLVLENGYEFN